VNAKHVLRLGRFDWTGRGLILEGGQLAAARGHTYLLPDHVLLAYCFWGPPCIRLLQPMVCFPDPIPILESSIAGQMRSLQAHGVPRLFGETWRALIGSAAEHAYWQRRSNRITCEAVLLALLSDESSGTNTFLQNAGAPIAYAVRRLRIVGGRGLRDYEIIWEPSVVNH
jgi:hypothetical protein